ncbi:DUF1190 domain-containing protein [Roseococcus pinisoli]|uniref:DUF1190 domain-containing protein n=1 Tax=Roseococcus pinisoli TaxID=2835040 RepID=A0ABS5QB30_9PROT|nr:DUF1190 domain-containing protein [Roseococcus pinisoli]MBS7810722.1 DUF1190 domain-containing protein [Roseococcus pinisoli]
MRRSRTVTLTILAASAVALQACGEDVDSTDFVVADVQACVERYGSSAQTECEQAFQQAQRQHATSAPRFATAEQCREATGEACETTVAEQPSLGDKLQMGEGSRGSSLFMPALAGVMIGRMMADGRGRVTSPVYAGLPPGQCPPGAPASAACSPRTSSSGRFYYTGSSYAGSTSGAVGRGSSAAFTASPDMARTISTGGGAWSGARAAPASIARGGFGASARGFSASS